MPSLYYIHSPRTYYRVCTHGLTTPTNIIIAATLNVSSILTRDLQYVLKQKGLNEHFSFRVSHDVGSVGCLKSVKQAISVARSVMEHTQETLYLSERMVGVA